MNRIKINYFKILCHFTALFFWREFIINIFQMKFLKLFQQIEIIEFYCIFIKLLKTKSKYIIHSLMRNKMFGHHCEQNSYETWMVFLNFLQQILVNLLI